MVRRMFAAQEFGDPRAALERVARTIGRSKVAADEAIMSESTHITYSQQVQVLSKVLSEFQAKEALGVDNIIAAAIEIGVPEKKDGIVIGEKSNIVISGTFDINVAAGFNPNSLICLRNLMSEKGFTIDANGIEAAKLGMLKVRFTGSPTVIHLIRR